MNNLYSNMKKTHIIIAFLLIIFLINFNFLNHIYENMKTTIVKEKLHLSNITHNIKKLIYKFNNEKTLLEKIKVLENKVMENKYEIGYLKNKNRTRKDIINIFKDIVLKSKVKLNKIETLSEQAEKETGKILIRFTGSSKLDNFISLLDMIENTQEFLTVQSYKLQSSLDEPDTFNIEIILKFIYINT